MLKVPTGSGGGEEWEGGGGSRSGRSRSRSGSRSVSVGVDKSGSNNYDNGVESGTVNMGLKSDNNELATGRRELERSIGDDSTIKDSRKYSNPESGTYSKVVPAATTPPPPQTQSNRSSSYSPHEQSPPHEQLDFDIGKVLRTRNPSEMDDEGQGQLQVPEVSNSNRRSLRTSIIGHLKPDMNPLAKIRSRSIAESSIESNRISSESQNDITRVSSHVGINKLHHKAHKLVESLSMEHGIMYYGHKRHEGILKRRKSSIGLSEIRAGADDDEMELTPDLEEHLLQLSMIDKEVAEDVGVNDGTSISEQCSSRRKPRSPYSIDYLACENDHDQDALKKISGIYGVDTIIENQRGWIFMGYPFFSDKSLFPLDPKSWTYKGGAQLTGGKDQYPLPDSTWEWIWKRWYVDMSGDVDDQGWRYSWRFGSSHWHGTHFWFRSFVRKRAWKRIRKKIRMVDDMNKEGAAVLVGNVLFEGSGDPDIIHDHEDSGNTDNDNVDAITDYNTRVNARISRINKTTTRDTLHPLPVTPIISISVEPITSDDDFHRSTPDIPDTLEAESKVDQLIKSMNGSRIDRERIEKFLSFVTDSDNISYFNDLQSKLHEILESLEYRDSRNHLVRRLEMKLPNEVNVSSRQMSLAVPDKQSNLTTPLPIIPSDSTSTSHHSPPSTLMAPSHLRIPEHTEAIRKLILWIKEDITKSPYFSDRRLAENKKKGKGKLGNNRNHGAMVFNIPGNGTSNLIRRAPVVSPLDSTAGSSRITTGITDS